MYKLYLKNIIFSCQPKGWKPQGCFFLLHRVPFRKAVQRTSFQPEHIARNFARDTGKSNLHRWTRVCFLNLEYLFFEIHWMKHCRCYRSQKDLNRWITQILIFSSHIIELKIFLKTLLNWQNKFLYCFKQERTLNFFVFYFHVLLMLNWKPLGLKLFLSKFNFVCFWIWKVSDANS